MTIGNILSSNCQQKTVLCNKINENGVIFFKDSFWNILHVFNMYLWFNIFSTLTLYHTQHVYKRFWLKGYLCKYLRVFVLTDLDLDNHSSALDK